MLKLNLRRLPNRQDAGRILATAETGSRASNTRLARKAEDTYHAPASLAGRVLRNAPAARARKDGRAPGGHDMDEALRILTERSVMAHLNLRNTCLAAACLAATAGQAAAQEAESSAPTALFIELNSAQPLDQACRLTFMATNALGTDVDQLVLETVLLTTDGKVDRLTLFDLQALPADRPRVRQFDVPGLACDALGKVLINGIQTCTGAGLDPKACTQQLDLSSRIDVEILG